MIPKDTNGFDVVLGATLAVDLSGTGAVLMICSTSSRRVEGTHHGKNARALYCI